MILVRSGKRQRRRIGGVSEGLVAGENDGLPFLITFANSLEGQAGMRLFKREVSDVEALAEEYRRASTALAAHLMPQVAATPLAAYQEVAG